MEDRTIAGRYRLTDKIGAGGMGVVWRGEDLRLRRVVAVKELLSRTGFDQESIDRAIREGRIAARLTHPNVIALYDVVEQDGHPWLIMEYLPSRSLATLITERGMLPADEVARLGGQLASGLAAAHAAGVVHRDVKPGNVLVTEFGTVKVTDFGTSHASDEVTVTASGMLVGTPAYLAPEVARGGQGEFPADVFALGATLYAAVEGAPPFGVDGNAIALLHRVADGRFTPPQHAGPLAPVLMRLLDADPATRPTMPEAARMLQDVRFDGRPTPTAIMASPPVSAEPDSTPQMPLQAPPPAPLGQVEARERRGDRKAIAVLAALALIAAVVVVYLVNRDDDKGSPTAGSTSSTTATSEAEPTASEPTGQPTGEPQATTTDEPEPTTTAPPPEPPPPAQIGPDQALSDYYGLLPGNLEAGYARLTDRFKGEFAQTFADYQAFWTDMSAVSVSGVEAVGSNQVAATVSYTKHDGSTSQERHLYTLVNVEGQWLIDDQDQA